MRDRRWRPPAAPPSRTLRARRTGPAPAAKAARGSPPPRRIERFGQRDGALRPERPQRLLAAPARDIEDIGVALRRAVDDAGIRLAQHATQLGLGRARIEYHHQRTPRRAGDACGAEGAIASRLISILEPDRAQARDQGKLSADHPLGPPRGARAEAKGKAPRSAPRRLEPQSQLAKRARGAGRRLARNAGRVKASQPLHLLSAERALADVLLDERSLVAVERSVDEPRQ